MSANFDDQQPSQPTNMPIFSTICSSIKKHKLKWSIALLYFLIACVALSRNLNWWWLMTGAAWAAYVLVLQRREQTITGQIDQAKALWTSCLAFLSFPLSSMTLCGFVFASIAVYVAVIFGSLRSLTTFGSPTIGVVAFQTMLATVLAYFLFFNAFWMSHISATVRQHGLRCLAGWILAFGIFGVMAYFFACMFLGEVLRQIMRYGQFHLRAFSGYPTHYIGAAMEIVGALSCFSVLCYLGERLKAASASQDLATAEVTEPNNALYATGLQCTNLPRLWTGFLVASSQLLLPFAPMTKINLFVILVSLYSAFTRYKIARAINTVSGTKRSSGPALSALEGLLFNPATAPPLLIYLILSLMVSPRILHVHPEAIFGSKMLLIISCLLQIGILAYFLTVHHRWFQSIATACHEKQIKSRINPTIALATLVGTGILPIIFAPLPLGLYWLAMTMPGFLLWWSIKSVVVRCVSVSDVQSEAENSDT